MHGVFDPFSRFFISFIRNGLGVELLTERTKPIIRIKDASFRYSLDEESILLRDVNFSIYEGEHILLLGTSGSGKSMFVKSIMGLLFLDSGIYEAFDRSMKNPSSRILYNVRHKIGILPDKGILIQNRSVRSNLAFPLQFVANHSQSRANQIVDRILDENCLLPIQSCLPFELSINMIKTVGLLRALIFDPKLLILDDPIEGLDHEGFLFLRSILKKVREKGETTIFTLSRKPLLPIGVFSRYYEICEGRAIKEVDEARIVKLRENFYAPWSTDGGQLEEKATL